MKSWTENWDVITPIFKFSVDVRKVIYTTNAIESLNSTYRKLNRQRSVFPGDHRDWGRVYGEMCIMYEGRLPD